MELVWLLRLPGDRAKGSLPATIGEPVLASLVAPRPSKGVDVDDPIKIVGGKTDNGEPGAEVSA